MEALGDFICDTTGFFHIGGLDFKYDVYVSKGQNMKQFKVLGTGCAKCVKTAEMLERISQELGVPVTVAKETNVEVIMGYGVMSTPAVVLDEVLVHSGSIPNRDQIETWLK
jgi:small redox-active disulfide protein 2